MKKYILVTLLLIIFFTVIIIAYWLYPVKKESLHEQNKYKITETAPQIHDANRSLNFSSTSQQDIQINCQLTIKHQQFIINEQTKNCFEFFITQYGEKKIDQINQDFNAYIKQNYLNPAQSQILNLWNRYLQYRTQLPNMAPSSTSSNNQIQDFLAVFNNLQKIRKQFFSNNEIEGLFGEENTYYLYTLKRMEILADKYLSEQDKAKKLQDLFKNLPENWQENLEQLNKLEDLQQLTSDIKARGGSHEEIRQMRLNLVGSAATERLENLDVQRRDWNTKVNQYLLERDAIKKNHLKNVSRDKALQQLKEKYFISPNEQLRIETFEHIHDQGGTLPLLE